MAKTSKFDAADYLKSPEAIADYLSEAFETGDEKFIAEALGAVARAKGMAGIATETGLSREGPLSFSQQRRPSRAGHRDEVLDAFDMQLVVRPKETQAV